jgi:hypothetical protein
VDKECKHEWHAINPFQRICCNCNAVTNVVALKIFSQKESQEMYTQNPELTDERH